MTTFDDRFPNMTPQPRKPMILNPDPIGAALEAHPKYTTVQVQDKVIPDKPGDDHATAYATIFFIFICYFFPWIIARARRHHNQTAIFWLNFFLGWTLLGWVGALVWANTNPSR